MAISQIGTNQIKDDAVTSAKVASGVGSQPPIIDTISPVSFSGGTGQAIVIKGNYFVSGCVVKIVSSSGAETTPTLAFNSTTQLTATTNTTYSVAGEPYSIKVTNPDGLSFIKPDILDAGGSPTWNTASGQIGSSTIQGNSFSTTVSASDPDGSTIVYSESGTDALTGSGSGKLGFTLNSSSGAITGTMPSLTSDTTFNFTLGASDGTNLTTRAFNIIGLAGTETVNYIYGGVITTVYNDTEASGSANYGVATPYGISGGITNGYRSHGAANYSDNTRQVYSSGYNGNHSGASSQGSNEIFTAQGNEDGRYYAKCGGSGSTGVGISVGWYTGRLYVPSDHNRMRIEFYAHNYSSNNSSTGGDISFKLMTSISRYAYGFGGTDNTSNASPASGSLARLGSASNYGGKATGSREFDANIDASVINGSAHYFAFYASGGQYSNSAVALYRVATYNSVLGLA